MKFLTSLVVEGASFSAVNTAKSALANCVLVKDDLNWIHNNKVSKFMKGVFNTRPPLPKYSSTWNVDTVLDYIENKLSSQDLSLKHLTLKTVMLIALTSGQRAQSIHEMDLNLCSKSEDTYIFNFAVKLKTSKPGNTHMPIYVIKNNNNSKLCPYSSLSVYIERTKQIRASNKLWLGFVKPFKPITRPTVSRWIKSIMSEAGIDKQFTGHSTRSASTSKAFMAGLGINSIMKTAHWQKEGNFYKFYRRHIGEKDSEEEHQKKFSEVVLGKN